MLSGCERRERRLHLLTQWWVARMANSLSRLPTSSASSASSASFWCRWSRAWKRRPHRSIDGRKFALQKDQKFWPILKWMIYFGSENVNWKKNKPKKKHQRLNEILRDFLKKILVNYIGIWLVVSKLLHWCIKEGLAVCALIRCYWSNSSIVVIIYHSLSDISMIIYHFPFTRPPFPPPSYWFFFATILNYLNFVLIDLIRWTADLVWVMYRPQRHSTSMAPTRAVLISWILIISVATATDIEGK